MIENIEQIKKDYEFDKTDVERILSIKDIMQGYADEFIERFYRFIFRFPEASKFLKNEEIINRHKIKVKEWYLKLFEGNYNLEYFLRLNKIGEVHVNIGLPTHYVNASFNFVRRFIIEKINYHIGSGEERNQIVASIGKLLDMNLDIITMAYREEELSKLAVMSKFEKSLFYISRKFADILDIAVLVALIIVALLVFALFFYDLYKLTFGVVDFEYGILSLLGALLIMWAVGELMSEEIKHFKGGGFALYVFIGIALAAMIRKILIASLSAEKSVELLYYSAVILSLGVVFWLIKNKENRS
ncbi:hypothetical protein JCM14244_14550 [Venenivibrio stagnispumantis]|uniref:Phosphate starvation-inducible membrane PsiE n=1 Tax=Venenivibrio stagnispumantis TaxID=407998 RepID=A0AA45WL10_9AQUI|nr:protoglobin domain-containing protein [Venenivibrio stagnispumantis]MCW4573657.1 protoglobin domain-containing protein [Venenivibrio stagnispumantis]SMP09706.1 Phosphate starvation-inducible membrane PsiE [Venenivibrio stagnispumantis]